MALHVIGAGFGRTGTNSLKIALEQLGYDRCHHMKEVLRDRQQIRWFYQAVKGEPVDWDEIFADFKAAVDWPSSAYYKELAAYYPEAKIILSVRDAENWYQSARETIYALSVYFPKWWLFFSPTARRWRDMVDKTIWQGVFAGKFEDHDYAIDVFRKHIEEVKATIPADRLLIHEAKEGWEPLCHFLDKPVPTTPYPRVNEAKDLKRIVKIFIWTDRVAWLLVTALSLGLALYWLR